MSYFLLLKPFHMLSGMALLDGDGSPHFHEPEGAEMPQAKTKDGKQELLVLVDRCFRKLLCLRCCFCTTAVLRADGDSR